MNNNIKDVEIFLLEGLSSLNLNLDKIIVDKIIVYFELLLEQNKYLNLISSKQDIKTQTVVHLLDSISILLFNNLPHNISAMDFGSGGGLPAIPLSIVFADWKYTLVESTRKKTDFLANIKNRLSLDNITIINKFLEPAKPDGLFYDLITARAVSNIEKLISISGPRLNKNGLFIAYKGPQGKLEIENSKKNLKINRMKLINTIDFILPFVDAKRSLFIFKKF